MDSSGCSCFLSWSSCATILWISCGISGTVFQ
jgi:hypothetical protein